MIYLKKRIFVVALLNIVLLAGCGNPVKHQAEAGSFTINSPASSQTLSEEVITDVTSTHEGEIDDSVIANVNTEHKIDSMDTDKSQSSSEPIEEEKKVTKITTKENIPTVASKEVIQKEKVQSVTPKPTVEVTKDENTEMKNEPNIANEIKELDQNTGEGKSNISWSQFFDNEDQTTPSDDFWDLSGSNVEINGYMGEVLSFEKNWFLLIPKPGAECPFDNGDETYWNKIMIVFVSDDVKLRHHTGPLKISGKLDVGVKIDESGYKTMFRLYDATFEEIKE